MKITYYFDILSCHSEDVELEDITEEERATFGGALFLGGYWSDEEPVISFEDGHVARWYRSGSWD